MKNKVRNYCKVRSIRKERKRGAAALEVILISGMLIALAVGLLMNFGDNINSSGDVANDALENAIDGNEIQR